jgi:hypothetical protein
MSHRTYAWAARGRENQVFVLYAGCTSKETKQRFSGGYTFKRLNSHRDGHKRNEDKLTIPSDFKVIENIRKPDIHLVHEEEIESNGRCIPTVAQYKEQTVINTCRAVVDHLEKELKFRVACGNVQDSVGSAGWGNYKQWVEEHREGRWIYRKLFNEFVDLITRWQERGAKVYDDENYMIRTEETYQAVSDTDYKSERGDVNVKGDARFFDAVKLVAKNMKSYDDASGDDIKEGTVKAASKMYQTVSRKEWLDIIKRDPNWGLERIEDLTQAHRNLTTVNDRYIRAYERIKDADEEDKKDLRRCKNVISILIERLSYHGKVAREYNNLHDKLKDGDLYIEDIEKVLTSK